MDERTPTAAIRYFCPRCRWEMPPDAEQATPGWAFCSVCGTALTTDQPATMASAPPLPARGKPAPVLEYAGFWRRFGGYVIDTLIVLVGLFGAAVGAGIALGASGTDISTNERRLLAYAMFALVGGVYQIVFNATGGTLGKRALGLRLVDEDGGLAGWRRPAIRYVISIFSGLVFSWGYWRMIFEREKQTLHDQAAGTYVVPADALV